MQLPPTRHAPRQGVRGLSVGRLWPIVAATAVVVVAVSLLWRGVSASERTVIADPSTTATAPAPLSTGDEAAVAVARTGTVEVPTVVGMSRSEAELLLGSAGLVVSVAESSAAGVSPQGGVVTAQEPAPSTLVAAGTSVSLRFAGAAKGDGETSRRTRLTKLTVCIDPGHQAKGDETPEPIGPGSSKTKARITGGATGIRTGVPEYEVALQIAMNLRARLESRGVKVVMTRTTNDVDLGNAERAVLASERGADLTVRIHCDGSPDPEVAGLSVLYPARTKWTARLVPDSKRAAETILASTVTATGAVDRGVEARADHSGFNWSRIPVVLVQCGYLSNPVEDRLLTSPHYQDRLAEGIATGVLAWATGER